MIRHFAAAGVAVVALASTGASAQDSSAPTDYQYALTYESAGECMIIQNNLREMLLESDPERARKHQAMSYTWLTVADRIKGSEMTQEDANAMAERVNARLAAAPLEDDVAMFARLARRCEIISSLHYEYSNVVRDHQEQYPELYADRVAMKLQTGGEPADPQPRELEIDGWTYSARGQMCLAVKDLGDGAEFSFRFTNFGDGGMRLVWDRLPALDMEAEPVGGVDLYEQAIEQHRQGLAYSETDPWAFADGVDYDSFPGSAIFADGKPVAALSDGISDGTEFYFGAHIQSSYYNHLAEAKVLTVKILGEETHRITFDSGALWNEMSECVAQYPFG